MQAYQLLAFLLDKVLDDQHVLSLDNGQSSQLGIYLMRKWEKLKIMQIRGAKIFFCLKRTTYGWSM